MDNTPEDAILIIDKEYNFGENIGKIEKGKYVDALIQSDRRDLMALPLDRDSFIETRKTVYGRDHRIVVYHSSLLEKMNIIGFLKHFRKVYRKAGKIIESGIPMSWRRQDTTWSR